jgi:hypothetical protein
VFKFLLLSCRSLKLSSARFFQDSSMALEAFLSNLSASTMLRVLDISKEVTDLACFELEPLLDCISRKSELESVSVQGALICTQFTELNRIEPILPIY